MRTSNTEPEYYFTLHKENLKSHIYQMFFINDTDQPIKKLTVKLGNFEFDSHMETDSLYVYSEDEFVNLPPKVPVLVGTVSEISSLSMLYFGFLITLDDKILKFSYTMERMELLENSMLYAKEEVNPGEIICYPRFDVNPLNERQKL